VRGGGRTSIKHWTSSVMPSIQETVLNCTLYSLNRGETGDREKVLGGVTRNEGSLREARWRVEERGAGRRSVLKGEASRRFRAVVPEGLRLCRTRVACEGLVEKVTVRYVFGRGHEYFAPASLELVSFKQTRLRRTGHNSGDCFANNLKPLSDVP
jgi:hypothetical protein